MTRSHRCWFITNTWKSDHRLNMTHGTDIKFALSFLSAKSLCWWKWILPYFKTRKLRSKDNLCANGRGLSVTWTVLSFQFTHIGHFSIPKPAVTFAELRLFVHDWPSNPAPLPKLRLTQVRMGEFLYPEGIPWGTDALTSFAHELTP